MRRAARALDPEPEYVLTDGFPVAKMPCPALGVKKGDAVCASVAAASIVAKVTRDREMQRHHVADPRYGYDRHKGYATRDHLDAVARYGYSEVHRRTFRPPSLFDKIDTQA